MTACFSVKAKINSHRYSNENELCHSASAMAGGVSGSIGRNISCDCVTRYPCESVTKTFSHQVGSAYRSDLHIRLHGGRLVAVVDSDGRRIFDCLHRGLEGWLSLA